MKQIKLEEYKKFEASEEYKLLNILEQILESTYIAIAENISLTNIYKFIKIGKNWWEFKDKENFIHQIKLNYNPDLKNKELTVKFYWIKNGEPSYNKPPSTDEKVFNTYLFIFLDEILPELSKLLGYFNIEKLTLDPIDLPRYRLYKIALNSLLDKNKYKLIEDPENNLLYIELIK